MSGQWIAPAAEEHRCRLPILWPLGWGSRCGDRWKCTDPLSNGERCFRIWRVVWGDGRREWSEETSATGTLAVFRPVTDDQLWYWINQELDLQTSDQDVSAETLVEVIRKHFEIGSRT